MTQNWEDIKVNKLPIVVSTILLGVLCSGILFSCFSPPKNTPCMPIDYPEGKKIEVEQGKIYTFETSDTYDDVYKFYRGNLELNPPTGDEYELATWREYPIRDIGVLFECASYLSKNQTELGCLFVNEAESGRSVIYAMWSYNEDPGIPCYELPEIEAEDYQDVYKP